MATAVSLTVLSGNKLLSSSVTRCARTADARLSKCDLFPTSRGVDFLGYRHFRDYILLRKSTAKRVRRRLRRLPALLEAGKISLEQFRSSVDSTWGWLKWANTHNLAVSLDAPVVGELVSHTNGDSSFFGCSSG